MFAHAEGSGSDVAAQGDAALVAGWAAGRLAHASSLAREQLAAGHAETARGFLLDCLAELHAAVLAGVIPVCDD